MPRFRKGRPGTFVETNNGMRNQGILRAASFFFVGLSALCFLLVSAMAFVDPQSVMNLVQVQLPNTDAASSIRGIYGGAGLSIVIMLIYLSFKDIREALGFLSLLWGLYAISRGVTQIAEGPLGAFGRQWILIEAFFCCIALLLLTIHYRKVHFL